MAPARRLLGGRRRSATEQELLVVDAVLRGADDPRADLFAAQVRVPGCVRRTVTGSTLELAVEWSTDDLQVEIAHPVSSRPVVVHDTRSGQELSFRLELWPVMVHRLVGTAGGRWPRTWAVDPAELARAARGALRLPAQPRGDATAVAAVLGVRRTALAAASLHEGASAGDLSTVPGEVARLLAVSDGLRIGRVTVLGAADVHEIVLDDGTSRWLVGQGRDGVHFLLAEDGVVPVAAPRADEQPGEPVATSYLGWVRRLLDESPSGHGPQVTPG